MKRSFFVFIIGVCMPVLSQELTVNPDDILAEKVTKRIHEIVLYGLNDYVKAEVSEGVLTLTGWTRSEWTAGKIESYAGKLEGIRTIDNQIVVVKGSDDLALRATLAIYRDPAFNKYLLDADPPVHVIVANNTLILAGYVRTEQERHKAAWLADINTTAIAIDNRLELNP